VTGATESGTSSEKPFPTTAGAFDTTPNVNDAFVAKLSQDGSALVYSTALGGRDLPDTGAAVKVDAAGNATVAGSTKSFDFPTRNAVQPVCGCQGSFDAFVTRLNPTGSNLVYSTFLGGISLDEGTDVALDASAAAYVTGQTYAPDFPTTPGAFEPSSPEGDGEAFVSKISDGAQRPCTITGTTGPDTLVGTPRADVICGLGGNDVLTGKAGDDVLRGGAGDDRLDGGRGRDTLDGGDGTDTCIGGPGADTNVDCET
jgi:Ca2+-binding RTX toxin-like protein